MAWGATPCSIDCHNICLVFDTSKSSLLEYVSLAPCIWRKREWHTFFIMCIESSKCWMGNYFQYSSCEFKANNLFILGVCKLSAIMTHKFIQSYVVHLRQGGLLSIVLSKYIFKKVQNGWLDGTSRL